MSKSPLRIGLLGASRIAPAAVLQPAQDLPSFEVTRIAASSPAKAEAYAKEHNIPGIEPDYHGLVTSDEVDVVYNALPPVHHLEFSVLALKHNKHVLCEKPFAMNAREAAVMVEAANASDGVLMEAFHYRFHPLFHRVMEVMT